MPKLTKFVAPALIAAAVLGGATSASAYPGDHYGRGYGQGYGFRDTPARAEAIRDQLDQLQARVNRADHRDRLSDREAYALRRDIAYTRQQFRDYNRDGLSDREFRMLQARIDRIRLNLHMERADWDRRVG